MNPSNILLIIGSIFGLLFAIYYAKKVGLSYKCGVIIAISQLVVAIVSAVLFAMLESGKLEYNGVSYYGTIFTLWIVPFIASKIIHESYYKIVNYIAPVHMLLLGFMKIGCHLNGCCRGIYVIINNVNVLVPIQIIEAVIAFILFVIFWLLMFKINKYMYPTLLIVYGIVRFVEEFLRYHKRMFINGLFSQGQLWSIIAVVLGIILFIIIYKKQSKELN